MTDSILRRAQLAENAADLAALIADMETGNRGDARGAEDARAMLAEINRQIAALDRAGPARLL